MSLHRDQLLAIKRALRQTTFVCSLPFFVLLFIFVSLVPDSAAEEEKPTVAFSETNYALELPYGGNESVPIEVILSDSLHQDITITYEVTSADVTNPEDSFVEPFGKEEFTIPSSTLTGTITLTIKHDQSWITGDREVQIELQHDNQNDAFEIGAQETATLTIARIPPTIYLPAILWQEPKEWELLDSGPENANILSLAVCSHDDLALYYVGTDVGIFLWKANQWTKVSNVPGNVREIAFGATCDHVYAAVLGNGVWGTSDGMSWGKIGSPPPEFQFQSSRTVIVRGDYLYTGTDTGIYYYGLGPDPSRDGSWEPAWEGGIITRLTLAGNRIFAGVWEKGVLYNDSCNDTACDDWKLVPGPNDDKFVRDVIGRPPINDGGKPDWLLFATATTVYWWDDNETGNWSPPDEDKAPQPTGNVFSLAGNHGLYYAGVESGGVWVTKNAGRSWIQVGDPKDTIQDKTVRDIAITDDKLYAATFENGVWVWPLP